MFHIIPYFKQHKQNMSTAIIIAIIIIILVLHHFGMKRIDKEEQIELNKPDSAHFLRSHYNVLIDKILEIPGYKIVSEKGSSIRMEKRDLENNQQITLSNCMGWHGPEITIIYQHKQDTKEWRFDNSHLVTEITNEVINYINSTQS